MGASLSAKCASRGPYWRCAESRWPPLSSCSGRRWKLCRWINTCSPTWCPITTPWPQASAWRTWMCCSLPNLHQDPDKPGEQWDRCWDLAKESLKFRPHGPEPSLPGGGWHGIISLLSQTLSKACMLRPNMHLMKSSGMYPSNWGNDLMADQSVGSSMLLSCDQMLDNNDGMAQLYSRPTWQCQWGPWPTVSPVLKGRVRPTQWLLL